MKSKVLSSMLGLAVLAATASAGVAGGDWGDNGINNYSSAVPVPAPIPVPMYHPLWYFRFDVGGGFGDSLSASESGASYGAAPNPAALPGYYSAAPFGIDEGWISEDYTKNVVWNLGVGYYWTRKFRTDLTMESRRDLEVSIDGTQSTLLASNAVGGPHPAGDTYDLSIRDQTLVRGAVFMVNGYYDFAEYGPLKPYIGAGIGFGYTDLERKNETTIIANDVSNATVADAGSYTLKDRQQVTSLALAATVGFSYEISDITQLDFAYRFLWVEGVHADLPKIGSSVEIDDTTEHQFRAGLRFNVY